MISIIAAVAKNNVIGKKGELPWYIPEDLKHFKKLTLGKTVLMGANTFDSIVKRLGKPFPGRKNVVVTLEKGYKAPESVLVYFDLNTALKALKNEDIYVCGGGQIYKQTINLADVLYITHVDGEPEGDVFFPEIDQKIWKKTESEPHKGFEFAKYVKN